MCGDKRCVVMKCDEKGKMFIERGDMSEGNKSSVSELLMEQIGFPVGEETGYTLFFLLHVIRQRFVCCFIVQGLCAVS